MFFPVGETVEILGLSPKVSNLPFAFDDDVMLLLRFLNISDQMETFAIIICKKNNCFTTR